MVKFKKRLLDPSAFEACAVFDVNNDGALDIVCGDSWYEGPGFEKKHKICDVAPADEYFMDFSDYGMDVNGDGYMDIITGSWWGEGLYYRENPGNDGEWATYKICEMTNIETIRYCDIDNCGVPEIFPNAPGEPQSFFKLIVDPVTKKGTGKFQKYTIGTENAGHGMGFGDINGDGKVDVILGGGWLEQPDDPYKTPWEFHREFDFGTASVPILAYDVTGNGLNDIIVGQAHNYGLAWYEQKKSEDGSRSWVKHDIDTEHSQYHDLQLHDIDNDGELELISGQRYRAHNGHDPGEGDDIGTYYFKINKGDFEKVIIDYGSPETASGVGIYFAVADLNGNGRLDIVAPGKEGLYIFENLGE